MKWIKVEDQKPPIAQMLIGYQKNSNADVIDFMWYWGNQKGLDDWESYQGHIEYPTHWMHLPHPPELPN